MNSAGLISSKPFLSLDSRNSPSTAPLEGDGSPTMVTQSEDHSSQDFPHLTTVQLDQFVAEDATLESSEGGMNL